MANKTAPKGAKAQLTNILTEMGDSVDTEEAKRDETFQGGRYAIVKPGGKVDFVNARNKPFSEDALTNLQPTLKEIEAASEVLE